MSLTADRQDYLLLFLLATAWGSSFTLIKVAVETIPPLSIAAGRILIGALLLLILMRARGAALPRRPRAWLKLALMGVIGIVLPFSLIGWGEARIDSGLAAILIAVVPFATILLAHVFVPDEPLSAGKLAGLGLGFLGILLLIGPAALNGLGNGLLGQSAIVAAALCYAVSSIIARRPPSLAPDVAAAGMLVTAAIVAVPVALLADHPWDLRPTPAALAAVGALGLISTAGGYVLFFRIIGRAGAGFSSFNNFLVPVMGVLWGALLLGERIDPRALLALGLILSGLAAPRLRLGRTPRRRVKS